MKEYSCLGLALITDEVFNLDDPIRQRLQGRYL